MSVTLLLCLKIIVFSDLTPYSLTHIYQLFGQTCCLQLQGISLVNPENSSTLKDGGSKSHINVGKYIPDYMTSRLRGQQSSYSHQRKTQMSLITVTLRMTSTFNFQINSMDTKRLNNVELLERKATTSFSNTFLHTADE
jgi:hypothetical protein